MYSVPSCQWNLKYSAKSNNISHLLLQAQNSSFEILSEKSVIDTEATWQIVKLYSEFFRTTAPAFQTVRHNIVYRFDVLIESIFLLPFMCFNWSAFWVWGYHWFHTHNQLSVSQQCKHLFLWYCGFPVQEFCSPTPVNELLHCFS